MGEPRVVVLDVAELEELVERAVRRALDGSRPARRRKRNESVPISEADRAAARAVARRAGLVVREKKPGR